MLQKGFTLIELMIVVAIVGILSMFAVVLAIDYTKRMHIAEGMTLASAAKVASAIYSAEHGVNPPDNATAGLGIINSAAVDGIEIKNNAIIITYNDRAGGPGTITLGYTTSSSNNKTGVDEWRCLAATLKKKLLPKSCAAQF